MLGIYRSFLFLYPKSHRAEFGDEMLRVFAEAERDLAPFGTLVRAAFYTRELAGLATGALEERIRSGTGVRSWEVFPVRRHTVRSEFRFPKFTLVLMTVILGAIVFVIEQATAIRNSVADASPHVGPIQPVHFTFLPAILLCFACAYVAGMVGWAILFALRRSGLHRLDAMHGRQE